MGKCRNDDKQINEAELWVQYASLRVSIQMKRITGSSQAVRIFLHEHCPNEMSEEKMSVCADLLNKKLAIFHRLYRFRNERSTIVENGLD